MTITRVLGCHRVAALPSLMGLLLACALAAAAQDPVLEVEPSGTPQNATSFEGPSLLIGAMTGSDQDAFLWTVSDGDAHQRWNLELKGIAGAATLLRRPAHYTLTMTTEARDAPGPGSLRVVAGPGSDGAGAGSAVDLILDASGSMLQRMEGRRRIEIARELLTAAIREHIPAGTPTALRVFGHKTPSACETDLEIPLAPLDPQAAVAKLAGITAKNLARTPIAASLAAVPRDLGAAAKGGAGFETWYLQRSNPNHLTVTRDEIRYRDPLVSSRCFVMALSEIEGIKIRDRVLTQQLCDINNDQVAAVKGIDRTKSALSYEVYNQDGAEVAEGLIGGESVELDRGIYRVVVTTMPRHAFENVELAGDEAIELEVANRAALCRFFDFARQFGMIGCGTAFM